ncbi:hypothetical protein GCM10009661_17630 [Catellatospora chokoriensis]|uniref:Nitroreductase domain-containing protein n=2 Tax=Catellatospora chokoriensis TaxID=310353 RepID=A0A8J3NNR3_9ACTN|nr:hypothetical protein Cch02nite_00350 [Catellatospora chokoriensis]
MGYAHDYATAIMHRGRVAMPPFNFEPNWPDAPRKSKFYPDAENLPLPDAPPPADATVQAGLDAPGEPAAGFTLPLLGGMLRDSYGLLGRRLGVQANTDMAALPQYAYANWHRGTASGGGLYPCSVYWVSGSSGPMTPGIYYYANPQHAFQRLLTGDVTERVRRALGDLPLPEGTDQFLVIGVKYWQNAFKYNSFSYHAVSMDVGTVLQTWRMWAQAQGLRIEPALWFDAAALGDLVGAGGDAEGVFAVVPLAWAGAAVSRPAGNPEGELGDDPAPTVRLRDRERSRTVLHFPTLTKIHRATSAHAAERPDPGALAAAAALPVPADGERITLPAPQPLDAGIRATLRSRRSSFGRFEAERVMTAGELGTLLAATATANLNGDAGPAEVNLTKLYAYVNHVQDVPAGSYEYDPRAHALRLVDPVPPGDFLQRNYFLSNYNLEQAGAVVVPTIRTAAVLDAVGDRGYNVVNATIGAVAQIFYTASAALDLGCGVALGFDNISYIEQLGIEQTGEMPLLIMLVGHERRHPADFRYELV